MQSGSWIQTTGPNNGHQLRDYSKSSNRSENRPLICKGLKVFNSQPALNDVIVAEDVCKLIKKQKLDLGLDFMPIYCGTEV